MSKVIDYLYELGLTSLEKIESYFLKTDIDTILSFDEYIGELVYMDWKIAEYSPYSFAPSIDVSGFGGCSEIGCKIRRANKFIKFSSLYSDYIYLIINSITNPHSMDFTPEQIDNYREELISDYSLILLYSDLIREGIARIIPSHFSVCPDCFAKYVYNTNELDKLKPIAKGYALKAHMEVTEYFHDQNLSFIRLSNLPELFPDHDGLFAVQGGIISDVCKTVSSFPYIITDTNIVHGFIEENLFKQFITTKFETFISSSYQSKYITSKVSDKSLIDRTSPRTIGNAPPPIFEMPFLENIGPKAILDLRKSEYDAFNEYRIAIDKASKHYLTSSTDSEFRDIYDDIVYPAFVKIDGMFKRAKRAHTIKTLCELAVVSSTVTLGIMNSAIPKDPISIVAAAGGSTALLTQLGKVIDRKISSGNELEQQDFYFLWKLKNQ